MQPLTHAKPAAWNKFKTTGSVQVRGTEPRSRSFQCSVTESDAEARVVNTQHGRNRSVSGRFWQTGCCIPNTFRHTCLSKSPAQTSATGKRSVGVDRSESTSSTTTRHLQRRRPLLQIMITTFLPERNRDMPSMVDLMILGFRPTCVTKNVSCLYQMLGCAFFCTKLCLSCVELRAIFVVEEVVLLDKNTTS